MTFRDRRVRNAALGAAIVGVHLILFVLLARVAPVAPIPLAPPVVLVELFRPSPPPPPPPPDDPAPVEGGGAPAAPSRIHVPPDPPRQVEPELPAPVTPAPEPDPVVVGVAPTVDPTPGFGQGGEGIGTGAGTGEGSGPGSGTRWRPIRGPTEDQIRREYPREALRAGEGGQVAIACRIRLDTRIDQCRVTREDPPGRGFGPAALAVSRHFRIQPSTRGGRPVADEEFTVGIEFRPRR